MLGYSIEVSNSLYLCWVERNDDKNLSISFMYALAESRKATLQEAKKSSIPMTSYVASQESTKRRRPCDPNLF